MTSKSKTAPNQNRKWGKGLSPDFGHFTQLDVFLKPVVQVRGAQCVQKSNQLIPVSGAARGAGGGGGEGTVGMTTTPQQF